MKFIAFFKKLSYKILEIKSLKIKMRNVDFFIYIETSYLDVNLDDPPLMVRS